MCLLWLYNRAFKESLNCLNHDLTICSENKMIDHASVLESHITSIQKY